MSLPTQQRDSRVLKYEAQWAREAEAKRIADRCRDAYSADAYANWPKCADVCLKRGLSAAQTEAVLRSKWTRWARDSWTGRTMDGCYPAKALDKFLASIKGSLTREVDTCLDPQNYA